MSFNKPEKLSAEMEKVVREMFPPTHPDVVAACKLIAWGKR